MIESATFVIGAWQHVVDFAILPFPPTDPVAALQASMRGERQETPLRAPLLSTGIYAGPINLTVEALDARPEANASGWEDILELSLIFTEGRAFFNRPGAFESKDVGTILLNEIGSYRARLHATGRDAAFDAIVKSPVEQHLVQFWKESPSPVSVLSSKSSVGKSLPRFIEMWQRTPTAQPSTEPRPFTGQPRPVGRTEL